MVSPDRVWPSVGLRRLSRRHDQVASLRLDCRRPAWAHARTRALTGGHETAERDANVTVRPRRGMRAAADARLSAGGWNVTSGFLLGIAMGVVVLGGIVLIGMTRERRARGGKR